MSHLITHVIFDFTGTLVDLFTPSVEVMSEFAEYHGKMLTKEMYENFAEVENPDQALEMILHGLDLDNVVDIVKEKKLLFRKFLTKGIKFNNGVEKLLAHLSKNGIQMAIATNLKSQEFKVLSSVVQGFDPDQFSHIVCGGDDPNVIANKPSPDVYLECLKRFKNGPAHLKSCLIFEDNVIGMRGALSSGIKTVLVNNGYSKDLAQISCDLDNYYDSFEMIDPCQLGLPSY